MGADAGGVREAVGGQTAGSACKLGLTCKYAWLIGIGGRMKSRIFALISLVLLAACGEAETDTSARALVAEIDPVNGDMPSNNFGFREALATGPDLFGEDAPDAQSSIVHTDATETGSTTVADQKSGGTGDTQIAYSYGFGFRIAKDRITELQQAHSALCEAMGPECRVLRISQANSDWDGFGEVKLQVASSQAGAFEEALIEPVEQLGGELVSSVRDGEDLSESIIDTEARLQSRLVLRDKLTAVLRNSTGSAAELVKAEQAIAEVNEDIDATRSKLKRYRNRIHYSDVKIEYQPEFGETQLGFSRPVVTALRSIGTTLGTTVAVLIYILTALVPVTLLVIAIRWVLHKFGLRIRFWKARQDTPDQTSSLLQSD